MGMWLLRRGGVGGLGGCNTYMIYFDLTLILILFFWACCSDACGLCLNVLVDIVAATTNILG